MASDPQVVRELPIERSCPFSPPTGLTELRDESPIRRLMYHGGHEGWLVTGHAAARAVLADVRFSSRPELFRSPAPLPPPARRDPQAAPGILTEFDPPEHTRYRRLLTGQFTVRRMNQLTSRIEQITEEHLDAMEQAGPPTDLVTAYALPIPSLVICELLGVPYADREQFQRNSNTLFDLTATPEQSMAAFKELESFLLDLVRRKRSAPEDDLISGLLTDDELTDQEAANIGIMLLIAGHETTANMIALGVFALLRHPDQLAALRADPDLAANAVEELMRYLSIVHIGPVRTAVADVEIEGQLIRAGESVTVSVPAANWDPAKFPEPERLDLTRRTSGHLAFGHGVHQCLGQQLARVEMRVAYPALLRRFPNLRLTVAPEEVRLRTDMAVYGVHELPVAW
ncbi:cytochrome P450 [Streptoalloteichus hindustanus]|uniref:Cytochrome P450 n=1 Tax=Streptoalloteichus hindustanus TaxID=2017 RepID=A0A1M4ZDD4_STRHI|nr:cytochrome P450 [Streptoalloteichus hindustanus]SHF16040.1 Cytochrome P450 [Streptoalloteichus hindustanus]